VREFRAQEDRFAIYAADRYEVEFLADVVEVGEASGFAGWELQHGELFNILTRTEGLLRIEDLGGVELADRLRRRSLQRQPHEQRRPAGSQLC
jgi:hypothetical protein